MAFIIGAGVGAAVLAIGTWAWLIREVHYK
jgi:hypothetical protein